MGRRGLGTHRDRLNLAPAGAPEVFANQVRG